MRIHRKAFMNNFGEVTGSLGIQLRLYVQSNLTKCEMVTYRFLLGYDVLPELLGNVT
jgi:hypothetical protein